MAIKTYKGNLTMLGHARCLAKSCTYSAIEIGGHTLKNIQCDIFLSNYLSRALEHEGEVILEIKSRFIFLPVAISVTIDGKKYEGATVF